MPCMQTWQLVRISKQHCKKSLIHVQKLPIRWEFFISLYSLKLVQFFAKLSALSIISKAIRMRSPMKTSNATEQIRQYKIILLAMKISIAAAIVIAIVMKIFLSDIEIFGINIGLIVCFFMLLVDIPAYFYFRNKIDALELQGK